MVSLTGPLATLDPGNQEKGNPEALVKTSLNAEVAEERRFGLTCDSAQRAIDMSAKGSVKKKSKTPTIPA